MAISGNYGLLQKQVADECGDNQALLWPLNASSGLSSPIQNAIQQAIAKWERFAFYFNSIRLEPVIGGPFNTVYKQEYYGTADYAPLGTMATIKTVRVLIAGNRYLLNPRDESYLDQISVNASVVGQPTEYNYENEQLRLYPIPDNAYPLGIVGTQRFAALANAADSNAWTNDGFDLIRCEAKLILARDVLYDADMEQAMVRAIYGDPRLTGEIGYLGALKKETTKRNSKRVRIRPVSF